jgi:hypothetical protein
MQYNQRYVGAEKPRLAHSPVEKPALGALGVWLQQVNTLLTWREDDENWLRQKTGMPTLAPGESEADARRERALNVPSPVAVDLPDDSSDEQDDESQMAEFAEEGRQYERKRIESKMQRRVLTFLSGQMERVQASAGHGVDDDVFWEREEESLRQEFLQELLRWTLEMAGYAVADTSAVIGPSGVDWGLVNADAARWARDAAGIWIKNITQKTRDGVRETVAAWIDSGGTLDDLTKALAPIFGKNRAALIASTEVTRAYARANELVWGRLNEQGFGIVPTVATAEDELVCPICGPKNGKATADEGWPPYHPGCRCWTVPRIPI